MAAGQDFLSLCNSVLRRFNEVELTAANFVAARGFHAQVRDAVNAAVQDISAVGVLWPFNQLTRDEILTPGTALYPPYQNIKPDPNSFRLLKDEPNGIGTTRFLPPISYDAGLQEFDYNINAPGTDRPERIALARNGYIRVYPVPDKAYTIQYEGYQHPAVELVAPTDETLIPVGYRYVVVDGACVHCHIFRTDIEAASALRKRFEDGLKDMRKNLINAQEYARSYLSVA